MYSVETTEVPDPQPADLSGWFAVARSKDVAPGASLVRVVLGRKLLLFRTESGEARLCDVVCPHQGGQLEHGRVRGEHIVCPIHHFAYAPDQSGDEQGKCKRALRFYPVKEEHGLVLAFVSGAEDTAPWQPPTLMEEGWSAPKFKVWPDVSAHLNVALEEGSDSLHLATVHSGTGECNLLSYQASGPNAVLRATFAVREWFGGFGRRHLTLNETLSYFGAGMVRNHFTCAELGLEFAVFVCITPKESIDKLSVSLGVSMPKPPSFSRVHPALGLIARLSQRLALAILGRFLLARSIRFFEQDLVYWSRKSWVDDQCVHLDPAADSGPFFEHRAWIRQLYRPSTRSLRNPLRQHQESGAMSGSMTA